MKRLIIALALVALMSSTVFAEGLSLGFKGGLNLANWTGDDIDENKIKLCFGGGVFMNYPLTESISLQPELLFMMKGTKADDDDIDAGYRMTYIDIPILAKFAVPTEGAFTPCFFAGPFIALNLSAEMYMEDEDMDIKDDIKSTDFGLMFGGGFDYAMGEGYLTFDARYALGLTDFVDVEEDVNIKNTGIMFMVGYGFNF